MTNHLVVIKAVNELKNTLEVYDSRGMDGSAVFSGYVVSVLATTDEPTEALAVIKKRFLSEVERLEAERGEWLNDTAPKAIAKAVAYAQGEEVAFPGGSIWK